MEIQDYFASEVFFFLLLRTQSSLLLQKHNRLIMESNLAFSYYYFSAYKYQISIFLGCTVLEF